jgi:hypothetical protein
LTGFSLWPISIIGDIAVKGGRSKVSAMPAATSLIGPSYDSKNHGFLKPWFSKKSWYFHPVTLENHGFVKPWFFQNHENEVTCIP